VRYPQTGLSNYCILLADCRHLPPDGVGSGAGYMLLCTEVDSENNDYDGGCKMTSEQISLLTLLITILGWSVTALYQRRILERQIKAERELVARQLFVPGRVKQLEEFRAWLQESANVFSPASNGGFAETEVAISKWKKQFAIFGMLAATLDSDFPFAKNSEYQDTFETTIVKASNSMDEFLDAVQSKNEENLDLFAQHSEQLFSKAIPNAVKRLDKIIEQTATLGMTQKSA
jgi:hypothetical protein